MPEWRRKTLNALAERESTTTAKGDALLISQRRAQGRMMMFKPLEASHRTWTAQPC